MSSADNLQARRRAANKKWRDANKEKIAAYLAANKERVAAHKRAWYERNREEKLAAMREIYRADPEKFKKYAAAYYEENKEKLLEQCKQWKKSNPEKVSANNHKRRATEKGCGGKFSPDIKSRLMVMQKGKCAVCRDDLSVTGAHRDHIIPLALGGSNTDQNIQLLCPSCNSSKHAKHPVEFMQSRGFLL